MKKFLSKAQLMLLVSFILTAATVTGVLAASRMASVPPIQGHKVPVVVTADTVTGGGNPTPSIFCAQTNYFKRGQVVVFRVWGVIAATGGYALTPKNVAKAVVKIPGQKSLPLEWVAEPHNAPKVSYWETTWTVPSSYPLGVVNFQVVMKTKAKPGHKSLTGTYSQKGFSPQSQLQITT